MSCPAREIDDAEQLSSARIGDRCGGARERRQRIHEVLATAHERGLALRNRGSDAVGPDGALGIYETRRETDTIELRSEGSLGYPSVEDVAIAVGEHEPDIRNCQILDQRVEDGTGGVHEKTVDVAVGARHFELLRSEAGDRASTPRHPDVVAHGTRLLAVVQQRFQGDAQRL